MKMAKKAPFMALAAIAAFAGATGLTACGPGDTSPSTSTISGSQGHAHTFSDDWASDENEHWHVCTVPGCDAVSDKAAHEWGSGVVEVPSGCGTKGTVSYTCTVCGYERTETTPAGTHTYETAWSYDETSHWHEATCGHDLVSEEGKHEWNEQNVCEVCGYEMQYTEGLEYEKSGTGDNAELTVSSIGTATDTELVIPAYAEFEGETLPVTMIGEEAFRKNVNITSVVIPHGVLSIEKAAFTECLKLTNVVFPDTLKRIERMAFAFCEKLQDFELPQSLLSLQTWSFMNCVSLTSVTIPSKVQYVTAAFANCFALKTVSFPKSDIIGSPDISSAFEGCSALQSVTLPEGMTIISDSAFRRCESLASIDLPDAVTTIESDAFAYCARFATFTVPENVIAIEDGAFDECSILEVFNKSGLNIVAGDAGFGGIAANAVNVYTPTSGSSVITATADGFAFIKEAAGWSLIKYMGEEQEITIPSSFVSNDGETVERYTIRSDAFDTCEDLASINALEDNAAYSSQDGVLYDKSGSTLVRVPTGRTGDFVIPDAVSQMEDSAFHYCAKLESVTFNGRITAVEYNRFKGCAGLVSITLGEAVNDFYGSPLERSDFPDLREINVPEGNGYYKSYGGVLYDYDMTTVECLPYGVSGELYIPDGVQYLGSKGLRSNPNITSVSLPSSLKRLGYGFWNCSNLTSVTFRGTMEQWKKVSGTKVNGQQSWRDGAVYDAIVCTDGSIPRTEDNK